MTSRTYSPLAPSNIPLPPPIRLRNFPPPPDEWFNLYRNFPLPPDQIPDLPISTSRFTCQEQISHYYNKYIQPYGPDVCHGSSNYPKDFKELFTIMNNISDKWDQQIACVLTGNKKVAMTDYDQFNEEMKGDREWYYEKFPMDVELRKLALKCGIQRLYANDGTEFYFRQEYTKNAEILINSYSDIEQFPDDISEIIHSLLLGYTDVSIICYMIYQDLLQQLQILFEQKGQMINIINVNKLNPMELDYMNSLYRKSLDAYIPKYSKLINDAKRWILQRGGSV